MSVVIHILKSVTQYNTQIVWFIALRNESATRNEEIEREASKIAAPDSVNTSSDTWNEFQLPKCFTTDWNSTNIAFFSKEEFVSTNCNFILTEF